MVYAELFRLSSLRQSLHVVVSSVFHTYLHTKNHTANDHYQFTSRVLEAPYADCLYLYSCSDLVKHAISCCGCTFYTMAGSNNVWMHKVEEDQEHRLAKTMQ